MKTKGLFETHLLVSDLDRSVRFYESLGMKLGVREEKAAFLFFNEVNGQMLGLRPPVDGKVLKRHFAFEVEFEDLLRVPQYLAERGIALKPVLGRGTEEPIVHTWMPAAAYYFDDPDGNELEYIAILKDEPLALSYVPDYSEWLKEVANRR